MYEKKKVKVFFKNGYVCEGTVMQWDEDAVLQSNDDFLHLYNVKENVLMVHIYSTEKSLDTGNVDCPKCGFPTVGQYKGIYITGKRCPCCAYLENPQKVEDVILPKPIVEPEPPTLSTEESQKLSSQELRLKKLAELRAIQQQEVKEQITKRVKSHVPTDLKSNAYEYPNFTK